MSDTDPQQIRGIRNNNPGNLDQGIAWDGLTNPQTDPRFCTFTTPQYGIRALAKTLIAYQQLHGLNTIRGIINRWAPPVENDTSAYVTNVSKRTGISPDTKIDVTSRGICTGLVEAIIRQECSDYTYPTAIVDEALTMAGVA